MEENKMKLETSIRNSGFSMLLCCVLGFVLLEAFIVHSGGKPFAHALVISVGALAAFVIHRALVPYYVTAPVLSNRTTVSAKVVGIANMACWGLLVVFGYAGMVALSSGLITLFAIFAVCAGIIPWSKITPCRKYILPPMALIVAGTVLGMLTLDQIPHPIFFLLGVWMSWMVAVFSWLVNIFYRQRKSKASRLVPQ